jgi:hypothetical protein
MEIPESNYFKKGLSGKLVGASINLCYPEKEDFFVNNIPQSSTEALVFWR